MRCSAVRYGTGRVLAPVPVRYGTGAGSCPGTVRYGTVWYGTGAGSCPATVRYGTGVRSCPAPGYEDDATGGSHVGAVVPCTRAVDKKTKKGTDSTRKLVGDVLYFDPVGG